jgi:hypothetical protein
LQLAPQTGFAVPDPTPLAVRECCATHPDVRTSSGTYGDRAEVAKHFEFVRRADLAGDSEVQNALGVSYLEHLNFRDGKSAPVVGMGSHARAT